MRVERQPGTALRIPDVPLSYHHSGGIQEYVRQAEHEELDLPLPERCPRCGESCGWAHAGWRFRMLRTVRFICGELKPVLGLWIARVKCRGCKRRVSLLPSFRGAVQACCGSGDRVGFA